MLGVALLFFLVTPSHVVEMRQSKERMELSKIPGHPYPVSQNVAPNHGVHASKDSESVTFLSENNTFLVEQVGATVVLHCPAVHVGLNTVSWIRRRDYHLITVGRTLYTSDQRYQIRYVQKYLDWQLHIRYLQTRDEGVFECQVSSHPPVSLMTQLKVVEPKSEILGGPEKFLRLGSSLRLVCVLRKTTQPTDYVFWYLNSRMINYDPKVKVETSGDVSVLFLRNLSPASSGNYSCVPSNAKASTIHIHILTGGEIPAAIQSSAISTPWTGLNDTLMVLFLLLSFLVQFFSSVGSELLVNYTIKCGQS